MNRLFKQLRRLYFNKNKISKYLAYAIGEILLVIIGILMALWLNNLREASNNLDSECFYLTNLSENLIEDKNEIVFIINQQKKVDSARNTFLKFMKMQDFDIDELNSEYKKIQENNLTFFSNPSAFNSLKSSGNLKLIDNNMLQLKLSNLYEKVYYRINYNGQLYDQRMEGNSEKITPYYNHLELKFTDLSITENKQLENILAFEGAFSNWYGQLLSEALIEIDDLQTLITHELERCE